MLLGIDIGGTFTDAVVIEQGQVVSQVKLPTLPGVLDSLLAALDGVLKPLAGREEEIRRVALSTTLITNAVVTGSLPKVLLAVMPGPGVACERIFPVEPVVLSGYVDHQGRIVSLPGGDILPQEVRGCKAAVVSGKFSVRNRRNEQVLGRSIGQLGIEDVVLGQDMSGQLGFIRRTNSAYYTAATLGLFREFAAAVVQGLRQRGIGAPLCLLKADGGTMPLEWAQGHTVEAFFTGPAASVAGIQALLSPGQRAISIDIGGTTSDIAFWADGAPLLARRGAMIDGYPTAVRSFHLRSVALGGDSVVRRSAAGFVLGPERVGPAMALGGEQPTLTDAFLVLGRAAFGDLAKARGGMQSLAVAGECAEAVAQQVLAVAVEKLSAVIDEMVADWALQPVYRVQDVVRGDEFAAEVLIGVGGAAAGLVPALAERLGLPVLIPSCALVANAIGAAVARSTLFADLRANTAVGQLVLGQAGESMKIGNDFSLSDGEKILTELLREQAEQAGIEFNGVQMVWEEEFAVVRGAWRTGRIMDMGMQLEPGVMMRVQGRDGVW